MQTRRSFDELKASFLALKRSIEFSCDSDPSILLEDAKNDDALRDKCIEIHRLATALEQHEACAEQGLIAPVNVTFRKEWKNYTSHWRSPVSDVVINYHSPEMAQLFASIGPIQSVYDGGSEEEISRADKQQFRFLIRDLKNALSLIDDPSDEQESVADLIQSMAALWKTIRFSIPAAVQRAAQAPVLLVSPTISNKITPGDHLSLYGFWNEARKAYILGVPMASIAMSRATLEVLLKDVLNAKGGKLEPMIQEIKGRGQLQPPGDLMHRIQKAGDAILHALSDSASIPERKATKNPTKAALHILNDLKAVIEAY